MDRCVYIYTYLPTYLCVYQFVGVYISMYLILCIDAYILRKHLAYFIVFTIVIWIYS